MKKQIIIARYKENIDWTYIINPLRITPIIYNKGNNIQTNYNVISLPNIGKEEHTYLHHIYNNYDKLADVTFFIQADPFNHCPDFIDRINVDYNKTTGLTEFLTPTLPPKDIRYYDIRLTTENGHHIVHAQCDKNGYPHFWWSIPHFDKNMIEQIWDYLFDIKCPDGISIQYTYGGFLAVIKKDILCRPKWFYKKCLDLLENQYPITQFIGMFETMWLYIFNNKYPINNLTANQYHNTLTNNYNFIDHKTGPPSILAET